jgi:hypothetical protein
MDTLALEQVESNIGAELSQGAGFAAGFETPGEFFDVGAGGGDIFRVGVVDQQRPGQVGVGVGDNTPVGYALLERRSSPVGVGG